ncbi:SPOR domain-containing protein [Wenxinia saemankumensis]|uniref:Sporulation related domain-containing protein n=1 Tax=Wenxinia saemankumensis TaxID=1447782 RepID=A0A1M6H183_9RHOB|nr:SPOR domain-containing protein [Wenxinia saemankumensis]SHJ15961.1 Sporulation related domain-containing protein [Wenxinia saemankumensis]
MAVMDWEDGRWPSREPGAQDGAQDGARRPQADDWTRSMGACDYVDVGEGEVDESDLPPRRGLLARAGRAVQFATAGVSLALIIGVGIWGYRLLVRDATGLPVVHAASGPFRERPTTPGGEIALHAGLAVNEVAAMGGAAPTEETLFLAPAPTAPQEDDLIAVPLPPEGDLRIDAADGPSPADLGMTAAPAAVPAALPAAARPAPAPGPAPSTGIDPADLIGPPPPPAAPAAATATADLSITPDRPLTAEEVLALADTIARGAEPLSGLPPEDIASGPAIIDQADILPESAPGLARALRPVARTRTAPSPAAASSAAAAPGGVPVSVEPVPLDTVLVQLGAFPSPEAAREAWAGASATFADFIADRQPLIQEAESAGQTFFRLRVMGFGDLADARRFCSALVAESADCIPVVVR